MWVAVGTELWQHRYCPCSALLGGPTADHERVVHVFQAFNPFTAMLAVPLLLKWQIKVPNFTSLKFPPEHMKGLDTSIKMHSIERRFVIGPSNTLFAGVYVCTFQPGAVKGLMNWWKVECCLVLHVCVSGGPSFLTVTKLKMYNYIVYVLSWVTLCPVWIICTWKQSWLTLRGYCNWTFTCSVLPEGRLVHIWSCCISAKSSWLHFHLKWKYRLSILLSVHSHFRHTWTCKFVIISVMGHGQVWTRLLSFCVCFLK